MSSDDVLDVLTSLTATHGHRGVYGFRLDSNPIQHKRFDSGLHSLTELHYARRTSGRGSGLLITGPSGAGKTVLVSSYSSQFLPESTLGRTKIPVLLVTVPSSPTSNSLSEAILIALGYPKASRGSGPQKTLIIHEFFQRCDVELLILDEFQHLFYAPTIVHFRDVTDWLKNLISLTNVAVVACGLPEAQSVVDANEQLARRFSARFTLSPFALGDESDFGEFRSVLKLLQGSMPIGTETPLYEANMARRILVASYGLLDYVAKVIEGAVSVAARLGATEVDLEILAAGFRERIWREVPDRLNPFHPHSPLRPLDRSGEVFYLHTCNDHVGSAVSRRSSLKAVKGRR